MQTLWLELMLVIRCVSRFKEDIIHRGDLFPALEETVEGQSALLALTDGQVTLIQSNQCATVGYLGAAYLGPQ